MRAVTITVSQKTGVAGFVFPGDRIDLVLTQMVKPTDNGAVGELKTAETILRNLRVLATDQSTETEIENGNSVVKTARTVTLEVTPRIAEKIAVADTIGTLSLSLRSRTCGGFWRRDHSGQRHARAGRKAAARGAGPP